MALYFEDWKKLVSTEGSPEKVIYTPKETERVNLWKDAKEAEEDKVSKVYLWWADQGVGYGLCNLLITTSN